MTYVVSPGRTADSIEPFKKALDAFYEQLTIPNGSEERLSESEIVNDTSESPTSHPPQLQHASLNSMGYVHSSGMLLLTERLPLPIPLPLQNSSTEGRDSSRSLSSSILVGRIAAETVWSL